MSKGKSRSRLFGLLDTQCEYQQYNTMLYAGNCCGSVAVHHLYKPSGAGVGAGEGVGEEGGAGAAVKMGV